MLQISAHMITSELRFIFEGGGFKTEQKTTKCFSQNMPISKGSVWMDISCLKSYILCNEGVLSLVKRANTLLYHNARN